MENSQSKLHPFGHGGDLLAVRTVGENEALVNGAKRIFRLAEGK